MVITSTINLAELKGTRRLDPEYYQPKYIQLEKELLRLNNKKIKNLAFVTDGIHSSIDYDQNSRIRTISAQSVQDNYFDLSANTRISVEQHQKNLRTSLQIGDIIISSVGTIGNTAVVSAGMLPCNADRHVGIIRLKNKKVNAFYITTFLNSKYGKFQSFRESTGNVQLNLFIEKIKELVVPEIKNNVEIGKPTKEAYVLFEQSGNLFFEAASLLLSELGLQNFKPKDKLSYEVNLSEAGAVHRIDAEYFNPSYEELLDKTKNYKNGYAKLLTLAENIKPKFEPQNYPQKTFSYVELSDINASIGVIQSSTDITGKDAPSRAKRILKKNDIIVSSVEGSLEKVALVDEQFEGSLASTGFFQFRPEDIMPEVLLILSKSPIIQTQLKKECAGTILTAISKEAIKKLIIPILPNQIQQKIAKLIQQSHESRRNAMQLLEDAKRKVEEEVEKTKR